jgi:hypothetical protein
MKKLGNWTWKETALLDVASDGGFEVKPGKPIRHHHATVGEYPWDLWAQLARNASVSVELANLGRSLMREADQHAWSEELQRECGWEDAGEAMIELALHAPDEALRRWKYLMATDGERGRWVDGEWESWR